ncbi:uncharacterized protein VTP21DRAFT_7386 [Calcarisporiella thermophila]|uniref:uncharacterized protein n=1 Tax=Calcarisporiella thermophila TaxID=911321 RepID=UPI003742234C
MRALVMPNAGLRWHALPKSILLSFLLFSPLPADAQQQPPDSQCVLISRSNACPEFGDFYISNAVDLISPFSSLDLDDVRDTSQFDNALNSYVRSDGLTSELWHGNLACPNLAASNTYARYTTSILCALISRHEKSNKCSQDNRKQQPNPLCSNSCRIFAKNVEDIANNSTLCPGSSAGRTGTVNALWGICGWPGLNGTQSLCTDAALNEPNNCGFSYDNAGLCLLCSGSNPNLNSCCQQANVKAACELASKPVGRGLSIGAIIGIVIGILVVLGGIFAFVRLRRRRRTVGSHLSPSIPQSGFLGTYKSASSYDSAAKMNEFGETGVANAGKDAGGTENIGLVTAGREDNLAMMNIGGVDGDRKQYEACHAYDPQMEDEIQLVPGDRLVVERVFDDGWALGIHLTTSQQGFFPMVCIMPVVNPIEHDDTNTLVNDRSDRGSGVPVRASSIYAPGNSPWRQNNEPPLPRDKTATFY